MPRCNSSLEAEVEAKVAAALPPPAQPLSHRAIHRVVDCWAPSHIAEVLRALTRQGRARSLLATNKRGDPVRLYCRVTPEI